LNTGKAVDRRFYAVCAPGLEGVTARELGTLGAHEIQVSRGGVGFAGPLVLGFRANLWSRSAVEVRLRVARFYAPSERLLANRVREVDWEAYLGAGAPAGLSVSSSRSRLAHSGRVAELVAAAWPPSVPVSVSAAEAAGGSPSGSEPEQYVDDDRGRGADDGTPPVQRVYVRLVRDTCTLSVDMSGELLHRRGYRLEVSRGPLRETLAAALILALEWDPRTPFVDPMCGSGTLPIEAALLAMRVAPGMQRTFICERWPLCRPEVWEELRAEACAAALPAPPAPIRGSDRNAGAVGVARRNAERAGVAEHIVLERRRLADVEPPGAGSGFLLTNPPYGRRVREVSALAPLYADLGRVLATRFRGWQAAVVSAEPRLDRMIDLPRLGELEFVHGGLHCRIVRLDLAASATSPDP
jgi:putative N6-adenine-specific DNA methylase